jgi:UDP-N-acetylmuramate dehydrogenase
MKRLTNEPMAKHTTFRIGGSVEELIIPESEDELVAVFRECLHRGAPFRILGNGSNILVSDAGLKGSVIGNSRACARLEVSQGLVYAGASVKIQQFIRMCVNSGLKSPEYLFSVPASVGGAIFMNAGRGRLYSQKNSDLLESVRVYDANKNEIFLLAKQDFRFEFRRSIFHDRRDWLILGGCFRPGLQERSVGEARIRERMQFVKESQDYNHPTAGSVFKEGEHKDIRESKRMAVRRGGVFRKNYQLD